MWICEEELKKTLGDDITDIEKECNEIVAMLYEKFNLIHVFTDISSNIMNGGLTYAEGFDKICLIVDRDRNSFISSPNNDQYAYVLSKCNDHQFGLYITNPCFEFWLLLHFDEVFNLDQNKLLENPKVTSKRRYAENELKRMFVGFRKNSYNAKALIKNVDKAIANEKKFCEDLEKLENTLGSNVGILIEEMRK